MNCCCQKYIFLLFSIALLSGATFGQTSGARRVQIGINLQEVDHPESRQLGVDTREGAAITKVFPNSSAELAGLKAGDVIIKCSDRKIATCDDLRSVILGSSPGDKHRVEFYRGHQFLFVDLIVGRSPEPDGETIKSANPGSSQIPPPLPQPAQRPPASVDGAPQTPPDGWITTKIRDVAISVPPDWIASEFSAVDEGLWYRGSALLPEASISIVRNATFAELSRGGDTKGGMNTTIGRVPAECCFVETSTTTGPEKGMVVMFKPQGTDGPSVALVCFASAASWDQYERVFWKVLASVHIRDAGGTESE
jgi:hypothetical protein